ncbi:MAG: membrane associated rhomboid family serine protease [Salibacteraceae bacterium]|jgi:membrane associated rhomboid family serine protease
MGDKIIYQNSFKQSIIAPVLLVIVMWLVFGWEQYYNVSFNSYGILPRDFVGLRGVVLAPFIHGDFKHIMNNSYPILILGTAICYFYKKSAKFVLLYSILMTGIWVWAMARSSFHIGASGLIYAWGAFLFLSGVLNKNKRMMGLSLLVVFLYGSLVWGVLPLKEGVSWESHLFGAMAGFILAYVFKQDGPQRKTFKWEEEEEEYEIEFWNMTTAEINQYYLKKVQEKTSSQRLEVPFKYVFKPKLED